MLVESVADPVEFLALAGPLLLDDEARHNLIFGIAGTLRDHPDVYPEHMLWLVREDGDVSAAALRTPPFNLVLARPRTADALDALAETLEREVPHVPGVTAAVPEVDAFAELWATRTGMHPRLRMSQRVYRLEELVAPRKVPGRARPATSADRELLVTWIEDFATEALEDVDTPVRDAERVVDDRLGGTGGFVLWEHGTPVSLAGWGSPTPNGVRIGPVYTPPDLRGRGYGSAVTAAVSAERLAAGRRFCFLYTNLANPTSNRIYMDIGYEPVCDSLDYAFESS